MRSCDDNKKEEQEGEGETAEKKIMKSEGSERREGGRKGGTAIPNLGLN